MQPKDNKSVASDFSLFALRMILGTIFIAHGGQKLFGLFNGVGLEGTAKMMEGLGFIHPDYIALAWSSIEFIGAIFLIFGVFSKISAFLISLLMLVSIWKINFSYGFFIQDGGYEFSLLIIGACLPIICMGAGRWSIWD